ncbi:MAG: GAF domain-containing sensor histidine kinase [Anaerolineae bacterium]|nr:GAF domain-containing sensor histidine kinase [Anaerolineae bacterium]
MSPVENADLLIKTMTVLNEVGTRINQLDGKNDLRVTLGLIAEGAVRVVAQNNRAECLSCQASAVIRIYDDAIQSFDPQLHVAAGDPAEIALDHLPRPDGFGIRAIRQGRRLFSYSEPDIDIDPVRKQRGACTLVCYPLLINRQPVGAFYIYRHDVRPFSEIELLIFDNFVHQAAMAIHHGRQVGGLTKALTRKVREMEKLKWASYIINSRTNLDETLQEILNIGLDLTAAQYGSLELYNKKMNHLETRALAGGEATLSNLPALPLDKKSVVGWVALNKKSQLITDLQNSDWHTIYHPLPVDKTMRSELAVPLLTGDGALEGVLNIESPQPGGFTDLDQQLLETLANQAVNAIEEVRLLDALQEIVSVLLTAPIDTLFELIIERACELINVSAGAIWTLSNSDTLVLRCSNDGRKIGQHLPLKSSIAGQAIKSRQLISIDDVRQHAKFRPKKFAEKRGWVSCIIVPLLSPRDENSAVGSFSLYATHLRDFSDWDKKLLTCLANHAAVAIRDAEQRAQLKQAQERQVIAETFAAVGDVAANLVHQLNNNFGAISVRVQGIEEKCEEALADWPYLTDNLAEIAQSSRQAMNLVRDSVAQLRVSRLQPVEVAHCIELALQRAALGPYITIERDMVELPRVLAGERQLEMVFYNLIDNAIKAMNGSGTLSIIARPDQDEVSVTIADTGIGIPDAMQTRIFEFATTMSSPQSRDRLGFGLWWVKTFVDRFGGRVTVKSTLGQGSAFTIWLPAQKLR